MFGWGLKSITVDELATRLAADKPLLIDVREPSEFAQGHVPGAVNMPLGGLSSSAAKLDPSREVLLICRSGHRSVTAAKQLKALGFTNVVNVKGGTSAWPGELKR